MPFLQVTITSSNTTFLRDGGSISVTVNLTTGPVMTQFATPQNGLLVGGIAQGQTKIFTFQLPVGTTPAQFQSIVVSYHPNGGIVEDQWDATVVTGFIPDIVSLPFACRPAHFRQEQSSWEMTPPAGTCNPL